MMSLKFTFIGGQNPTRYPLYLTVTCVTSKVLKSIIRDNVAKYFLQNSLNYLVEIAYELHHNYLFYLIIHCQIH